MRANSAVSHCPPRFIADWRAAVPSGSLCAASIVKPQDPFGDRTLKIRPINHLDGGRASFGRGDWQAARRAFDRSLENGSTVEFKYVNPADDPHTKTSRAAIEAIK